MLTSELKINQFDSVHSFDMYTEQYYLPLLLSLSQDKRLAECDRRLIGFMHDDIESLVKQLEEAEDA